jgi:hypothetical protein
MLQSAPVAGAVNSAATATSSGAQPNPRTIQRVWLAFQHIRQIKDKPSSISKEQFANAVMDVMGMSAAIATAAGASSGLAGALTAAINRKVAPTSITIGTSVTPPGTTPDAQLHQLLTGMVERNLGDVGGIKSDLENWFDTAMDRLSGVYKRWTQLLSFFIAFALAIVLNVDSVTIAKAVGTADPRGEPESADQSRRRRFGSSERRRGFIEAPRPISANRLATRVSCET